LSLQDKASLKLQRSRLAVLEEQLRKLTADHEALVQQYSQVENERNALYRNFESTGNMLCPD